MNQASMLKSLLLILPHPITVDESCSAGICIFSEDQNDTNLPKRNRPRSLGRGHAGVPINQECERAERREVDQRTIDNLILSDGRSVAGIWRGTPISVALSPTLSKTTLFVGSLAKSGTGGRKEVRCAP